MASQKFGLQAQTVLACERCKRRKIKCDHAQPACKTCTKGAFTCNYPLIAQKPGPKSGMSQKCRHKPLPTSKPKHAVSTPDPSTVGHGIGHMELNSHGLPTFGLISATPMFYGGVFAAMNSAEAFTSTKAMPEFSSEPSTTPNSDSGVVISTEVLSVTKCAEYCHDDLRKRSMIDRLCKDLDISIYDFPRLLNAYFDNFTALSLFHRPTFEAKLYTINSPVQRRALLASMFAISAKYRCSDGDFALSIPIPETFRLIARSSLQLLDEALAEFSDEPPPLCYLQALVLTTFSEIVEGDNQAWASIERCIEFAHFLNLHLVDKNDHHEYGISTPSTEEHRRAWWAIWEFDIYASTVRKLPTIICWETNKTWMPIDDRLWFKNKMVSSCHLNSDPSKAWQDLEKCPNQSSKAWLIVLCAIMRCIHQLSYPGSPSIETLPTSNSFTTLDILSNALYCITATQPSSTKYQGELLRFSTSPSNSVQQDSAKYSAHLITQLSRFLLCHYQIFTAGSNPTFVNLSTNPFNHIAWDLYLSAASEIVTLIQNSAPHHVQHVSPFLAQAVWSAAGAQVASTQQALAGNRDPKVAQSNLELLRTHLSAHAKFWCTPTHFLERLEVLEAKLFNIGIGEEPSQDHLQHEEFNKTADAYIQGPDHLFLNAITWSFLSMCAGFGSI